MKPRQDVRPRVLLIAGSSRRQYNCPGVDGKARTLMQRMADRLAERFEVDVEDLANVYGRERIQSCNACVSTSMALCVWPCNCYRKDDDAEPDLMWNLDLYARLDLADAWAFIAPINWYGPPSNLKLMFDRLVCMNGGNPREDLIGHKDVQKALKLERTEKWKQLSRNHLEGRTAAFFVYGDLGADELDEDGRPKKLLHKHWFDPDAEPFDDERDALAPIVWQCRYSGIEVPDALWRYQLIGQGRPYSDSQAEHLAAQAPVIGAFDAWTDAFAAHVQAKGKVKPGRYRAHGYEPPPYRWKELKLGVLDARMRLGIPRRGSSPHLQQQLALNRDRTLRPSKSAARSRPKKERP